MHLLIKILILAENYKGLKKSAVLVSLVIYLCATTCLGELVKAPVLLSHFLEHRVDNDTITFYTFIYQHYQDDDGDDKDNDRDSQLPFKSPDNSQSSSSSNDAPIYLTTIRFTPFSQTSIISQANYVEPNISSPSLLRIWQPPKFSKS